MVVFKCAHPPVIACFTNYVSGPIKFRCSPILNYFSVFVPNCELLFAGEQRVHPIAPQVFTGHVRCFWTKGAFFSHGGILNRFLGPTLGGNALQVLND